MLRSNLDFDNKYLSVNGIPDDYVDARAGDAVPMINDVLRITEQLVKDINRSGKFKTPMHICNTIKGDDDKPIAILFGEQHEGGSHYGFSYARTNRIILDTLMEFYQSPELKLSDGLNEGAFRVVYSEQLKDYSKDDFIIYNHHPFEAVHHFCEDTHDLEFYAAEKFSLILRFIIYALLYNSLAVESMIPERENDRLLKMLVRDCDEEKLARVDMLVEEMIEDLGLQELMDRKIITRSSISFFYRMMDMPMSPDYEEACDKIKLPRLYSLLDTKKYPELEILILKIRSRAHQMNLEREEFIADQFLRFKSGVHPMVIGDVHLNRLPELLAARGISVIALSPFYKG